MRYLREGLFLSIRVGRLDAIKRSIDGLRVRE